jgi:O-acetyl-ADP-ribose deacetylase (regulator of RNase III)
VTADENARIQVVFGAIHRAAGRELLDACRAVPEVRPGVRCPTGESRMTPGFRLAARHVIHTVGPVWRGGTPESVLLVAFDVTTEQIPRLALQRV